MCKSPAIVGFRGNKIVVGIADGIAGLAVANLKNYRIAIGSVLKMMSRAVMGKTYDHARSEFLNLFP